jgi:hypothetical protein
LESQHLAPSGDAFEECGAGEPATIKQRLNCPPRVLCGAFQVREARGAPVKISESALLMRQLVPHVFISGRVEAEPGQLGQISGVVRSCFLRESVPGGVVPLLGESA